MTKRRKINIGLSVAVLALLAVSLWSERQAISQPTSPFPVGTITSVTSGAAVSVVAANPSRHALQICNGGGSTVTILPATAPSGAAITPVAGTGVQILVNTCYTPPTNILFSGSSWAGGGQWNAIAASTTSPVVALEW